MVTRRALLLCMLACLLLLTTAAGPEPIPLVPLSGAVTPAGALSAEFLLSPLGNAERYVPDVAYNWLHDEHMVVWHNIWPGGEKDIYARRIASSGALYPWFCVTTGPEDRFAPAIAYNSATDEYLVVWMQEASPEVYEIWGRVIPWNGPGTNADFQIITWPNRSFWTPKVAYNDIHSEYLVVWNAMDTSGSLPGVPNDIAGSRVSATGVVTALPELIALGNQPQQVDLTYSWFMDEYFVVYVVRHSLSGTGNDVEAVTLTWDGERVGPEFPISVCVENGEQNAPAVATDHFDRYAVVFEHTSGDGDRDLYLQEVYLDGYMVHVGYVAVELGPADASSPDVAAAWSSGEVDSAGEWLVVWQQEQSGTDVSIEGVRMGYRRTEFWGIEHQYIANYAFWVQERPAAATGKRGYFVAYEGDSAASNRHIYGRIWHTNLVYLPLVIR